MAFRLPPLNSVRVFEAAARHGSFRRAAEELHITSSAVSHGIQSLESWLGAELFQRDGRGLVLTAAGQAYLPQVSQALQLLAASTERLPGRRATGALSLSVAPTFASRWLLPRLARFSAKHPDIRIVLNTAVQHVDLPATGVDLAVRMSVQPKSLGKWTQLVQESLVPVCSPEAKARLEVRDVSKQLAELPLIHVTTVTEDWPAWFSATKIKPTGVEQGFRVDSIQLALDAAVQGLGIALGRKPLINDDLNEGRLVQAFGPEVMGSASYWLVSADSAFERPEIKLFRTWLVAELHAAIQNGDELKVAVPKEARS
jgi:LysR family transcriptional regulator, glycine cleavage system transcriptional activator